MSSGFFSCFPLLDTIPSFRYNNGMTKKKTSVTLSDEAIRLLDEIAKKMGLSKSSALEIIVREKAKAENIK